MAYITTLDARSYALLTGIDLPEDEIELNLLLNKASKALDMLYGARYLGMRTLSNQALYWPRVTSSTYDSLGNNREDFNGIPIELQHATVELAGRIFSDAFDPFQQPTPEITEETKKLDGMQKTVKYATPYATSAFYSLDLLLAPLLRIQLELNAKPRITMTRGA